MFEHAVDLGRDWVKRLLKQQIHSIEDETGCIDGISHTFEFDDIGLLDTSDSRFGSFEGR